MIMTINVGIIDDSVLVRSTLKKMLDKEPDFSVAGVSKDVYEGRSMILEHDPDVLTLDVEMPKMDGITFLERLMEHHPIPVVMVSSLTQKTSRKGMEALDKGAVEIVPKPDGDRVDSMKSLRDDLLPKLRAAYKARENISRSRDESSSKTSPDEQIELPTSQYDGIIIGSSTGGVKALSKIFKELESDLPPILVVQHMPPVFTKNFADRLNGSSPVSVAEGSGKVIVQEGEALLAPGDQHLEVKRFVREGGIEVQLTDAPKVHSQKPSVDVLFKSACQAMTDQNILSIVLTGMGKDGRDGAIELNDNGATVVVQDRSSSTIYGMPKQVKKNVPSAIECPLQRIPSLMNSTKLSKT